MKTSPATLPDFLKQQAFPCLALTVLGLFIWIEGTQWPWLSATTPRFCLGIAPMLAWLLRLLFADLPSSSPALSAEQQKKLHTLQGRLKGVIRFLHKTPLLRQGLRTRFSVLPWHLVIGPAGSGKTALLAHAGMRYVLSKRFTPETLACLPTSSTVDWWVTRDLVLVDMPGSWFSPLPENSSLWQAFLTLLRTARPLAGIVLTVHLPELMQTGQEEQVAGYICKQLDSVRSLQGNHLPVHLVITKCDLLPGFTDFFAELSPEVRTAAWGITLPQQSATHGKNSRGATQVDFLTTVSERFSALLKQLNKQLVSRLHQERNLHRRPLIKDFPPSLEKLRESLLQLAGRLGETLPLRGIWLTSALQPQTTTFPESGQFHLLPTTSLSDPAPAVSRPFFIRQFLQQGLSGWSGQLPKKQVFRQLLHRGTWLFSAGVLLAAALVAGQDFLAGAEKLHTLDAAMQRYQHLLVESHPLQPPLRETLAFLTALQAAALQAATETAQTGRLTLPHTVFTSSQQQSATDAKTLYRTALATIALPALTQPLDHWLQTFSDTVSPDLVYQMLSARLMLAGSQPPNTAALVHALAESGALPETAQDAKTLARLNSQLEALTAQTSSPSPDPALLVRARHVFARLPFHELGMVILKNRTGLPDPALFTQERFQNIINSEIAPAATAALQGNSVTGTLTHKTRATSAISTLRARYLQEYVKHWAAALHHLLPEKPQDLFDTDLQAASLLEETSPLLQALALIQKNTAFEPVMRMHPDIRKLDEWLASQQPADQNSQWQKNRRALELLHGSLQAILTADNSSEAAARLVNGSMRTPDSNPFILLHDAASQSPAPLKNWLFHLADSSWHFVVKEAGQPDIQHSLMAAFRQKKNPPVTLSAWPAEKIFSAASPVLPLS